MTWVKLARVHTVSMSSRFHPGIPCSLTWSPASASGNVIFAESCTGRAVAQRRASRSKIGRPNVPTVSCRIETRSRSSRSTPGQYKGFVISGVSHFELSVLATEVRVATGKVGKSGTLLGYGGNGEGDMEAGCLAVKVRTCSGRGLARWAFGRFLITHLMGEWFPRAWTPS